MPIIYDARVSIVNEGTSEIERYVAKITQLAGIHGEGFIKTFPALLDRRNRNILSIIEEELPPSKKRSFLGIGFKAYPYNNYIEFFSTFKSFPISKGDYIILTFENKEQLEFKFEYFNKNLGYMNANMCPISDMELAYIANNKMASWQLFNEQRKYSMVGGFSFNEYNKQYMSEKVGQGLFKKMAQEILASKKLLFNNDMITH